MTTKKPIMVVDLDDVCADLISKWVAAMNADHGLSLTPESLTRWDITGLVPLHVNPYMYFNKPGFFRDLAVFPDCATALSRLAVRVELLIVTDSPAEAFADKRAWVREHLPMVPADNFVATRRKDVVAAGIRIDDNPNHLVGLPGLRLLMDRAHNRGFNERAEGIVRVFGWAGAAARVRMYLKEIGL